MQCQQRKARRCPRSSRQVPEADRAPPADAFELLPERLEENPDRGRSECVLSGGSSSTAPAADPS